MSIKFAHIVAAARNGVIGVDNQLPWRLPADLRRFKALTMGKPIVMGRKTWESIGRPLPGRANIVVSRDPHFRAEGAQVFADIAGAMAQAEVEATHSGVDEVFVIGGETIYRQTLAEVDRVYLTEVDVEVEGDAFYPPLEGAVWRETAREIPESGENTAPSCVFLLFERR
ncbi:dihydrofolate reductase [Spongiibacter thalassae]|uniref:dihydrofolate reductase n=1 Tax=Spongiibacter thalassae TaxID=2721624 RepID=UPI0031F5CE00